MKIKRVHAADMQSALDRIRAELGPDAVIISTRPLGQTPEDRRRGLRGREGGERDRDGLVGQVTGPLAAVRLAVGLRGAGEALLGGRRL